MTDYPHTTLDLSRHSLNNSNSKLKYSFPKSDRFNTLKSPMYIFIQKIDVTIYMKFLPPDHIEQHRLDMEIKL